MELIQPMLDAIMGTPELRDEIKEAIKMMSKKYDCESNYITNCELNYVSNHAKDKISPKEGDFIIDNEFLDFEILKDICEKNNITYALRLHDRETYVIEIPDGKITGDLNLNEITYASGIFNNIGNPIDKAYEILHEISIGKYDIVVESLN